MTLGRTLLTFLRDDPRPLEVDLVGHEDDGGPPAVRVPDPPEVGQGLLGGLEAGAVHGGVDDGAGVGLVRGQGVLDLK